jgi:hypothetical protein
MGKHPEAVAAAAEVGGCTRGKHPEAVAAAAEVGGCTRGKQSEAAAAACASRRRRSTAAHRFPPALSPPKTRVLVWGVRA